MALTREQAIATWTERQRLISIGAYEERSAEHSATHTWPEDGVEESVSNVENWAGSLGLQFVWDEENSTWSLDPMDLEHKAAFLYPK